jgi:uncharacterized membrane protein YozB (DUF420 family)
VSRHLPRRVPVSVYLLVVVWVNGYICRQAFFTEYTGKMNSIQGVWIAMARLAGPHWFKPSWWPYWYDGMPFEYTYAPLVPGLTALIAHLSGFTVAHGFQIVMGLVYCLAPAAFFLMAWQLTRRPGWSFIAAMLYSLTALTELVLPDLPFSFIHLQDPRRLYLSWVWDELPHQTGLSFVCLTIFFLSRALQDHRFRSYVLAGLCASLAMLASAFGATGLIIFGACLFVTCETASWKRNILPVMTCGLLAYFAMCPFLPPSLIAAIRTDATLFPHMAWTATSTATFAGVFAGAALIWWITRRWCPWHMRFMLLLAFVCIAIPMLYIKRDIHFLPQSGRYKIEMEVALSLLLVFLVAPLVDRFPKAARILLALALLWPAYHQIVAHRRFSKNVIRSVEMTGTIEYQIAKWIEPNLPGWRVMAPGSIWPWLNTFSRVPQFAGGSFPTAPSLTQLRAASDLDVISQTQPNLVAIWYKAYGVDAVIIVGPDSPEFWQPHPFGHRFDGIFPVVWDERDTRIYAVPRPVRTLAHVIPAAALVAHVPAAMSETKEAEKYVAALEAADTSPATFRWLDDNHARIHAAVASDDQVVSIQITHHAGWKAIAAGRDIPISGDGIGQMVLHPNHPGTYDIDLTYNGGFEAIFCRV